MSHEMADCFDMYALAMEFMDFWAYFFLQSVAFMLDRRWSINNIIRNSSLVEEIDTFGL